MIIHAHFLASFAEAHGDGMFDVHQGGITTINGRGWPARAKVFVVSRLEFSIEEAAGRQELEIEILHRGRRLLNPLKTPLRVKISDINLPVFVNVIGQLQFDVPGEGEILIQMRLLGGEYLPPLRLQAVTTPGVQLDPRVWRSG